MDRNTFDDDDEDQPNKPKTKTKQITDKTELNRTNKKLWYKFMCVYYFRCERTAFVT